MEHFEPLRDHDELTPLQQQRRLNRITDQYFQGEIDVSEFLRAQETYGLDYEAVARALAEARSRLHPVDLTGRPYPSNVMSFREYLWHLLTNRSVESGQTLR